MVTPIFKKRSRKTKDKRELLKKNTIKLPSTNKNILYIEYDNNKRNNNWTKLVSECL